MDSVILQDVPKIVNPGSRIPVTIEYSLESTKGASISASLMYKGPNQEVSSAAEIAKPGKNVITLFVPVPGTVLTGLF